MQKDLVQPYWHSQHLPQLLLPPRVGMWKWKCAVYLFGLYFPQNQYKETVYVGQSAGTPVLQVHAMVESDSQRPHFYLCYLRPPTYAPWFHLDETTGILSMNKTLEWSDFDSFWKLPLSVIAATRPLKKFLCGLSHPTVQVSLTFINDTAPPCGQTRPELKKLCFPDKDLSSHIKENRFPGALRQLRQLTRLNVCPNYTISYSVESGEACYTHLHPHCLCLVVTAPLDREERETYSPMLICTVQTDTMIDTFFVTLHINVYDEDDNAPYVSGTDTEDVVLEFDRKQVTLLYFTTKLYISLLFVGNMMTNDSWINEMFAIEYSFKEEKAIFGNVRGTVHEFRLALKKNLSVTENRTFQLDYLVNDTTYPHPEGTVMLLNARSCVNLIRTVAFSLYDLCSFSFQVGRICVDNSLKFQGINVTYRLAVAEKTENVSDDVQSCYAAISIAQSLKDMVGLLYVNDTEALRRPECQDLQYVVIAQEQQNLLQASTQILVVLDSDSKYSPEIISSCPWFLSCAKGRQRGDCENIRGLGATTGRCQWRQGYAKGISESYSTCSPDLRTCPDGFCDAVESKDASICPQDCTIEPVIGGHEKGIMSGIRAGHGTCYCYSEKCFCEKDDVEEAMCDEVCKTIVATAVLLSFIVSILLSSYFIHRYHKNSPKPPITSAEMTFRRPAQSYPISYSANNMRRGSLDSMENQVAIDTFKIPEDPKWEFPRKNLVLGKTLGEGEFGKVVKATAFRLKGKAGYTTVAVKMLKDHASHSELRDLLSEFTLLKQVNHPHVIKMYGACSQDGPMYLIVEYAKYGSLRNFLRESRKVGPSYMSGNDANRNSSYLENPDERALTMGDLISFTWQISRGMQYLAEMKLVHRDLAARNVLVAEGRKMKISDFGLSRDVYEEDSYVKRSKGRIPVKWMAIESLFDHIYTTQSDVWSFGVLLWEIVTLGGNPYPGIAPERLFNLLKTGYRMEKPENCTEEMYNLMLRCWKQESNKRPIFIDISKELEKMMVKNRDYLDLAASTPADALLYDDALSEEDTPLVDSNNAPLPRTIPSTWIENKLYGRISHAFTRF
uniref:Proto-oncogene tyrosine-protein kinase receptor Ret n=1 Tax=Salmo trutta TaxID=8032 RepID=A0A673YIJ8_SALTR